MSMQPKSEDVQSGRRSLLGSCSFFILNISYVSPQWDSFTMVRILALVIDWIGNWYSSLLCRPHLMGHQIKPVKSNPDWFCHTYMPFGEMWMVCCVHRTQMTHILLLQGKKKLILNVKSVAFFSQLHTSDMPDFQTDLCNGFTTAPDKIQSAQKWPMCKKLTWF